MIDDKKSKLRTINNKYGVAATFDLAGNKLLDKEVKQHFKYGSDTIYVLKDDTVIMKKSNGESVILSPDESMDIINK